MKVKIIFSHLIQKVNFLSLFTFLKKCAKMLAMALKIDFIF